MVRKKGSTHLLFFTLVASLVMAGTACSGGSRMDLHKTLESNWREPGADGDPMLIAAYQPWFGRPNHINVGYSSQDRVVLQRQIAEAKQLGIRAFIVNWYGRQDHFEDTSYSLLQQVAAENGFKTAIMYDENDSNPGSTTEAVISDLQYAYDRYISPQVPDREAYLQFNGRPMIFIFPKSNRTNWNRVRQVTNSWEDPPLLIYEGINQKFANDFDGFFAWVHPGKEGWTRNGSNWGEDYLENFYTTMNNRYPDKIPVGAAWPGFNDSKASWSRGRKMDARCGKTFEDSLRLFRRYYNADHPLPFLMIVTWNDYEEGTAIERGYAHCGHGQSPPYNTFGSE
jgi:Glycosyl hydrolase family 71